MKSKQELNSLALSTRRIFGIDTNSPIDVFSILEDWKVKRVTMMHSPLSKGISGMCTDEEKNLLFIINTNTSYGRQRFTFAHLLYHVLHEENCYRTVCDMSIGLNKNNSEKEADIFASYLLIPYNALSQYFHEKGKLTIEDIIEAERYFQISHQAMLFRLEIDHLVSKEELEEFKNISISEIVEKYGYDHLLYKTSFKDHQYFSFDEYISKIEKIYENGYISKERREELLLHAYRGELYYPIGGGLVVDD